MVRKVVISALCMSHIRRRLMRGWNQLLLCIKYQLIFVGYSVIDEYRLIVNLVMHWLWVADWLDHRRPATTGHATPECWRG